MFGKHLNFGFDSHYSTDAYGPGHRAGDQRGPPGYRPRERDVPPGDLRARLGERRDSAQGSAHREREHDRPRDDDRRRPSEDSRDREREVTVGVLVQLRSCSSDSMQHRESGLGGRLGRPNEHSG